ncbi:MAG: type II secretion system protein GspL [Pseudomonadota bacterium]
MSSLIVALNPPSSRAGVDFSYALTVDGQTLANHGTVSPDLLPQSTELVAVVPARMLSWHKPVLPKAPGNRLAEVLQGVLEEQLLDDPQALHFALQPGARAAQGSGAPIWVAACDKAWLRAALQALEAAGRRISRVVPEMVPDSGQWWIYGTPQAAWCAQSDSTGVSVLPLDAVQGQPAAGAVFCEPAVAALAEKQFNTKVALRQAAQQLVVAAQSDWNLAQFDLASAGRKNAGERALHGWQIFLQAPQFRALRWGLATLLLVQFVAINAWAWKESSSLSAKRAQIRQLFVDTFPQTQPIIDPMAQMARDVAALQQAVGQVTYRDLEVMFSYVAAVLPADKAPSGFEFKPGEVKLKGVTLSAQELSSMESRLKEVGYFAFTQADGLVVTFNPTRGAK